MAGETSFFADNWAGTPTDGSVQLRNPTQDGTDALRAFIMGNIISDSPREIDRVTRYHLHWNLYKGSHWRVYNETFLSFNYVRAFINKVNSFLLGDTAFTFEVQSEFGEEVTEDLEKSGEAFIDSIWRRNKKVQLAYEILQMGAICGDVWVHLEWINDAQTVRITCLDSRYCFPEFEKGNLNDMNAFTIRQTLVTNEDGYLLSCTRYTKDKLYTWYQKSSSTKKDTPKYEPKEYTNEYGFIPIVHIKNKPNSADYYSYSDMDDTLKLNKIYNELGQQVKGIVDYYGTPTTVITGGTLKNVTKGLGAVWSGLPSEANVFNLSLGEDLAGTLQFMAMIKQSMHELSDVPENALGKLQSISNTSAAALKITYQPLQQQADLKSITYTEGFIAIHQMIFALYRKYNPKDKLLKVLPKDFEERFVLAPIYAYGLPTDRLAELNEAELELRLKLGSRKEIMNRMGKKNVPQLLTEIDDDTLREGKIEADVAELMAAAQATVGLQETAP